MSNSSPYGIGLIPSDKDIENFYKLMEVVSNEFDLSFSCKKNISIPHLTIFQGIFSDEKRLILKLNEVNLNLNNILKISGISIWANKIIFLDFELTKDLHDFHTQVFNSVFPLSDKESADPQSFKDISELEQRMYEETGYPFSLTAYKPHITMAHLATPLKETDASRLNSILSESEFEKEIKFKKLVIYKVGKLGRCKDNFFFEKELT